LRHSYPEERERKRDRQGHRLHFAMAVLQFAMKIYFFHHSNSFSSGGFFAIANMVFQVT
jgi:hypothetical protein